MGSYAYRPFAYRRPDELAGRVSRRRPVVVIGAGPVGLTLAIDLATRGIPTVLLDDNDTVSTGSRAICWAKRTLEIWDRLGVADRMVAKGVTWQVGRVYHRERQLFAFDLLPEPGHGMPAFVNLQQYYVEQFLAERAAEFPDLIDLRWRNEVIALDQAPSGATVSVATPDGVYRLEADYVVAADGARSPTRTRMGLPFPGQAFDERFLIADVRMTADFPPERWFWFEPAFHAGQSALLHKQPDDIYRIDFQLGPDADPELERGPERVIPRIRAVLGDDRAFELEWCSVYAFRCARLERFVHGRVIFAGDSAHVVSPFGARGGNGGIQDADNLAWKLALILRGEAPAALLDSYDEERGRGADENIANSGRTTAFMSPRTPAERRFRDGLLALAPDLPFARTLLNAGRLSRPCCLAGLSLQTPDDGRSGEGPPPGTACPDAPVLKPDGSPGWLLAEIGPGFTLLAIADPDVPPPDPDAFGALRPAIRIVVVGPGAGAIADSQGLVAARYGRPGCCFLVRPDGHVAARLFRPDLETVAAALARSVGCPAPERRAA